MPGAPAFNPAPERLDRSRGWRLGAALAGMLGLMAVTLQARADPAPDLEPQLLRVGWSQHAFLHVNRNEVEASFRALVETVGRRRHYLVTTTNSVLDDPSALHAAVERRALDLLIIDAWSFLHLPGNRTGSGYSPRFTTTTGGSVGNRYLLLARADSGRQSLADLRGQSLQLFEAANASLARHWLDTILDSSGLPRHGSFFGTVNSVGKPSTAVLPVFFGKASACVVDATGYNLMTELNPAVAKTLRVVLASEPLVDGFVCLRDSKWSSPKFKQDLIEALTTLHEEPAGSQILTMIKAGRLIPFEERYLDAVRRLHDPDHPKTESGPSPPDRALPTP